MRCPRCNDEDTLPIFYGEPTLETMRASERGEVALGGCVLYPDRPDRACQRCGHRWKNGGGEITDLP